MTRNTVITILLLLLFVVVPLTTSAQIPLNVDYPDLGGVDPTVNQSGPAFIVWIYYFGIALGAFLAVAMIAYGGFRYIMSFGNPSTAEDGKDRIKMAIFGFVLLLSAVTALNIINPGIFRTFTQGLSIEPVKVKPIDIRDPNPATSWQCKIPFSGGACFASLQACKQSCSFFFISVCAETNTC